jgi:actin-related protein 8
MKFKACILIQVIHKFKTTFYLNLYYIKLLRNFISFQDHVAATYGAGLGFACVVDVGHSKTSVSCVEDGISQTSTRIRLRYGGGNLTNIQYKLFSSDNLVFGSILKMPLKFF